MENKDVMKEIDVIATNGNVIKFITPQDGNVGIFVQDVNNIQNTELLKKGIELILNLEGKRGDYLTNFLNYLTQFTLEDLHNENVKRIFSKEYCRCLAFICDIALHANKKLVHKDCYHKDFRKYVANLMYNYFLDDCFNIYKEKDVFSVPNIMKF